MALDTHGPTMQACSDFTHVITSCVGYLPQDGYPSGVLYPESCPGYLSTPVCISVHVGEVPHRKHTGILVLLGKIQT